MSVLLFKKWGYHGKGGKNKKDMAILRSKNYALFPEHSLGSGTNEKYEDIYGYVFEIVGGKVNFPCSACTIFS